MSERRAEADTAAVDEQPVALLVRAHPGLCMGHGNCRRFAPSVYALDDEGYIDVHLVAVPPELADAAVLGSQVCPVHAITILPPPD